MNQEQWWKAVLERDPHYEGVFVYAVHTTGIYCRPTCPSRRPLRENVAFFDDCASAEAAGFRACRRCNPTHAPQPDPQTTVMVAVCRYLEAAETVPTLDALGAQFHLSPYHLQRTFKRIVGVSPRQYADAVRQGRLKAFLKDEATVTDAIYAAGYGASSQVYEQAHYILGTTPIHYRNGGEDLTVKYVISSCKLGYVLVAATDNGVCKISLGDGIDSLRDDLRQEFPLADLTYDEAGLGAWTVAIVNYLDGASVALDLPLDIQATSFQRKVWEALRSIPYGETRSYQAVADMIGQPSAARAVAQAVASNPVAMVIPCHRVVRSDGGLSGYRWGADRKAALLAVERGHAEF